jgi:hypothetical protein
MKQNESPGGEQEHPTWPGNLAAWALLIPSSELRFFPVSFVSLQFPQKMLPVEFD